MRSRAEMVRMKDSIHCDLQAASSKRRQIYARDEAAHHERKLVHPIDVPLQDFNTTRIKEFDASGEEAIHCDKLDVRTVYAKFALAYHQEGPALWRD